MVIERSFNPGELVVGQGRRTREFFSVRRGRFAIVAAEQGVGANGRIGAGANLVRVVDQPQSLLGEIDTLLDQPHRYSVVAIDPGEAVEVAARPSEILRRDLADVPIVGLRVCVSFALQLKQAIERLSSLVDAELAVDQLVRRSSRTFLAIIQELEHALRGHPGQTELQAVIEAAKAFPVCGLATAIDATPPVEPSRPSVANGVVHAGREFCGVAEFPVRSCLCRRGTIGNCMFVLMSGAVEVEIGPTTRLRIDQPGSIIGEVAFLLNLHADVPSLTRTADVVCVTPVRTLVLSRENVENYLTENPQLAPLLVEAMVERTRATARLAAAAKERLRARLFQDLRPCLEGLNDLGRLLQPHAGRFACGHAFESAAHHARQVYERFAEFKALLAATAADVTG